MWRTFAAYRQGQDSKQFALNLVRDSEPYHPAFGSDFGQGGVR